MKHSDESKRIKKLTTEQFSMIIKKWIASAQTRGFS